MNEQRGSQLPWGAAAEGPEKDSRARLWQALRRGKWILIGLPAAAAVVALVQLQVVTPRYRGVARLGVSVKEPKVLAGTDDVAAKQRNYLKQQVELFRSPVLLRPLAELPGLGARPHFRDLDGPVQAEIAEHLAARADTNADILTITFESPFPDDARWMVDQAVRAYREHNKQEKRRLNQEIRDIVLYERDEWQAKLEGVTARVLDHYDRHPELIGGLRGGSLVADRKNQTYDALTKKKIEAVPLRSTYETLLAATSDEEELRLFGRNRRARSPNPVFEGQIAQYQRELQAKQTDLSARLARGTPERNPQIVELRAEIDALEEQIDAIHLQYAAAYLSETRFALDDAERAIAALQAEFESLEEDARRLNRAEAELALLDGRRDQIQEELDVLDARILELQVGEEGGGLNITVLSEPQASAEPVWPVASHTLGTYLAPALALALALVLVGALRDGRIRRVEEVPDLLGSSVVAVLPALPGGSDRSRIGRVIAIEPDSLAAEAIRSLRTATSFGLPENGSGVVLVASSTAGEGKSITASNLALAMGQSGRRTLLVDADLRKPGQHAIFGVGGERGLGDVLRGRASLADAIVTGAASGMDLLPAGDAIGRAAELIEGADFRRLLGALRADYDVVVVDSSPVLETAEARIIASRADLTVFVMRLDVSDGRDAVRARDILLDVRANILGIMLNGSRSRKGAKSYAGGIAYGYGGYGQRLNVPDSVERVASVPSASDGLEAWS